VLTTSLGGVLGFFLVLVIAYTLGDTSIILGSAVGQPMATYCLTGPLHYLMIPRLTNFVQFWATKAA
jgi:hypothetical protein